jgi:hypothetical protein
MELIIMPEHEKDQNPPTQPNRGESTKRSDGGLGIDYVKNHREIGNGNDHVPAPNTSENVHKK